MNLGLIGYPISHSKSPQLYRKLLGKKLSKYDLIEVKDPGLLPDLDDLKRIYDGLNITTPYKEDYFNLVNVDDNKTQLLGSINTISFSHGQVFGLNTDIYAVEEILKKFMRNYANLFFVILGNGVMAKLTKIVLNELSLGFEQFYRSKHGSLTNMDLSIFSDKNLQVIIINTCSRDFIFKGKVHPSSIFWDYNYSFTPHQEYIPKVSRKYVDGLEMLELQARAAVHFWETKSKPI